MARVLLFALAFAISSSASTSAQPEQDKQFPTIKIPNFGQMDERFYRGAQPNESDYRSLAGLGITTIIDLRNDPTSYEERAAEAVGMRYVNIPMSDRLRPQDSQIERFLKTVSDPATGKFYVHCSGGRHRTGVVGAVYRYIFYKWNYEQVYREMKNYDFYTRWGHGALKDYIVNYYQQMKEGKIHTIAAAVSNAGNP